MRNLDECKSEIFRLGEEKIKKRKKNRKRIIAACIPLCLCLIVWSVTMLPAMLPASTMDGNANEAPMMESSDEFAGIESMEYAQVEIKGVGSTKFYNEVKEPLKTNYIANLIDDFYFGKTGNTDDILNYPEGKPESFESGYLISFITEKGFKVEYTLSGYLLKNNSTGASIILTDFQRHQLLSEITGGV